MGNWEETLQITFVASVWSSLSWFLNYQVPEADATEQCINGTSMSRSGMHQFSTSNVKLCNTYLVCTVRMNDDILYESNAFYCGWCNTLDLRANHSQNQASLQHNSNLLGRPRSLIYRLMWSMFSTHPKQYLYEKSANKLTPKPNVQVNQVVSFCKLASLSKQAARYNTIFHFYKEQWCLSRVGRRLFKIFYLILHVPGFHSTPLYMVVTAANSRD